MQLFNSFTKLKNMHVIQRKIKILTAFLLLVISLPLVYQPLHIAYHYQFLSQNPDSRPHKHAVIEKLTNEHCYILDFEFAIFKIKDAVKVPGVFILLKSLDYYLRISLHICFDGCHASLRAPPAIL